MDTILCYAQSLRGHDLPPIDLILKADLAAFACPPLTWLSLGGVEHEEGDDAAPGGPREGRVKGRPVPPSSCQVAWTGKHAGDYDKTRDFASSYPCLEKNIVLFMYECFCR